MDNQEQIQGRVAPNFDHYFDYDLMSPDLMATCTGAQPATDKDYRTVAKLLGSFCKTNKPAHLFMTTYVNSVTFNFVNRFKKFMDYHKGKVVNLGNDTLHRKVYGWVENNRDSRSESDLPKRKKRTEAQLSLTNIAPPVEDFESCTEKKKRLKDIFYSEERFDAVEVRALMTQTYALQRSEINDIDQKSMVEYLLNEWPFLFHPMGAAVHFTCGSNIDPNTALENFLKTELQQLQYYLIHKGGAKASKAHLKFTQYQNSGRDPRGISLMAILNMLSVHFEEDLKTLIVMVSSDLQMPGWGEAMENIPSTPCLVGRGTDPYQSSFIIMINSQKVAGPASFLQAIRVLFPLHFILSINYNDAVKKTCQFYERCVLDYTPQYKVLSDVSKALIRFDSFKHEMNTPCDLVL